MAIGRLNRSQKFTNHSKEVSMERSRKEKKLPTWLQSEAELQANLVKRQENNKLNNWSMSYPFRPLEEN